MDMFDSRLSILILPRVPYGNTRFQRQCVDSHTHSAATVWLQRLYFDCCRGSASIYAVELQRVFSFPQEFRRMSFRRGTDVELQS